MLPSDNCSQADVCGPMSEDCRNMQGAVGSQIVLMQLAAPSFILTTKRIQVLDLSRLGQVLLACCPLLIDRKEPRHATSRLQRVVATDGRFLCLRISSDGSRQCVNDAAFTRLHHARDVMRCAFARCQSALSFAHTWRWLLMFIGLGLWAARC
jgi:hypothetical protein